MLSFFVDAQASMLIVGSRGSGKTSMLQAMMLEIPQNLRIIVQEDTQEIPVPADEEARLQHPTLENASAARRNKRDGSQRGRRVAHSPAPWRLRANRRRSAQH